MYSKLRIALLSAIAISVIVVTGAMGIVQLGENTGFWGQFQPNNPYTDPWSDQDIARGNYLFAEGKYTDANQYNDAYNQYEKAYAVEPYNPFAIGMMGLTEFEAGMTEEAKESLEIAVDIIGNEETMGESTDKITGITLLPKPNPNAPMVDMAVAIESIGDLTKTLEDNEGALENYEKANELAESYTLKLQTENPYTQNQLGLYEVDFVVIEDTTSLMEKIDEVKLILNPEVVVVEETPVEETTEEIVGEMVVVEETTGETTPTPTEEPTESS